MKERLYKSRLKFKHGKGYIFLAALISSCSFIDEPHYYVQPELAPYVHEFHNQAKARSLNFKGHNLTVRIGDIRDHCDCPAITFYREIPEVVIDTKYYNEWQQAKTANPERAQYFDRMIEIAVFHELGHALLHLDHAPGIMSDKAIPYHQYCKYDDGRTALITHLFDQYQKKP